MEAWPFLLASGPLAAALALATAPGCDPAQGQERAQSAAELFESRCTACHLPPDPGFATDRAWLEQVHVTA